MSLSIKTAATRLPSNSWIKRTVFIFVAGAGISLGFLGAGFAWIVSGRWITGTTLTQAEAEHRWGTSTFDAEIFKHGDAHVRASMASDLLRRH